MFQSVADKQSLRTQEVVRNTLTDIISSVEFSGSRFCCSGAVHVHYRVHELEKQMFGQTAEDIETRYRALLLQVGINVQFELKRIIYEYLPDEDKTQFMIWNEVQMGKINSASLSGLINAAARYNVFDNVLKRGGFCNKSQFDSIVMGSTKLIRLYTGFDDPFVDTFNGAPATAQSCADALDSVCLEETDYEEGAIAWLATRRAVGEVFVQHWREKEYERPL